MVRLDDQQLSLYQYQGSGTRERVGSGILTGLICGGFGLLLVYGFNVRVPIRRDRPALVVELVPPAPPPQVAAPRAKKSPPRPDQRADVTAETHMPSTPVPLGPVTFPPIVQIDRPAEFAVPVMADQPVKQSQTEVAPESWEAAVGRRLAQTRAYPAALRARRVQGEVVLSLTVQRNGPISDATVARSSGSTPLDNAALQAAQRAAPLPGVPSGLDAPRTVLVPIRFSLH